MVASNSASYTGWRWRACHTLRTTRPPSVSTRRISRTDAARSGKNCTPCWHSTRSNAPSGRARAGRIPFPPLNRRACWCGERTGDGQHGGADIERDHLACRPNHGGDVPCHTAGATRHVQRTFARLRSRVLKQHTCPRVRDGRAKIVLVQFGWIRIAFVEHGKCSSCDRETAAQRLRLSHELSRYPRVPNQPRSLPSAATVHAYERSLASQRNQRTVSPQALVRSRPGDSARPCPAFALALAPTRRAPVPELSGLASIYALRCLRDLVIWRRHLLSSLHRHPPSLPTCSPRPPRYASTRVPSMMPRRRSPLRCARPRTRRPVRSARPQRVLAHVVIYHFRIAEAAALLSLMRPHIVPVAIMTPYGCASHGARPWR